MASDRQQSHSEPILNLAHRGASGHAPQNTMAAFSLAAEMGADGIELDVHLSADGQAVVIHNDTVDETTDGSGRVHQMTAAQLQSLDAGGWFDPRFAGEPIPTLEQVFAALAQHLLVNVEIKVEAGYHPMEQEAEVVRLIEDYDMVERVIVSSFSPSSLRRVHRMNPRIPLGFLYGSAGPGFLPLLIHWFYAPLTAWHPHLDRVNTGYLSRARRWRQRVNVWTVNAADDMRHMRDLGVDGIITNYPDVLRDVLAER
jgi:glycerophosphoryl diester phosphodiesterase